MRFHPPTPSRERHLTLRLSASEMAYLDDKAHEHGLSRSDLVREVFAGRINIDDRPAPLGETTDVEIVGR